MVTLLDLVISLLTVLMVVFPLFRDMIIKKQEAPTKSFFQRITTAGWWVVGFGAVLLFAVFFKDNYQDLQHENERSADRTADSTRFDHQLAAIHSQDSINTEQIHKSDSTELAHIRDSIIYADAFELDKLKKKLDSINAKKQRHPTIKQMTYILQQLLKFYRFNPKFTPHSTISLAIDMTDLESINFANEIKTALVKYGYDNAEITPMISFGMQREEIHVTYNPGNLPEISILPLKAIR